MKSTRSRISVAMFAVALLLAAPAWALERGTTTDGRPYATGGIGLGERDELNQIRRQFSLRVATAARVSGAFLSEVRLTITDAKGQRVLDRPLAGPVLLVDLAPGRYTVEAVRLGESKQALTTIVAGEKKRELYFYFDVPAADVRPKNELPF